MNRLQSELNRLYLPRSTAHAETDAQASELIDPSGSVRAMVLELRGPPNWTVLSGVWQGVQTELELPAPAIAVSGTDGLQLWFALAEPIPVAQAHAFLDSLRSRFLPDIEPGRIGLMPASDASAHHAHHARLVPACQEPTENWSAFVAPDLAPVFGDTPWLDIPPGVEGQATLLSGLEVMKPAVFEAAVKRLGPSASQSPSTAAEGGDPRQFLLGVMNDETVALALRIEAAKALLQHSDDHRPRRSD